jgi:hypothetical protein
MAVASASDTTVKRLHAMHMGNMVDSLGKLKLPIDGSKGDLAERLEAHFLAAFQPAKRMKCPDCKGVSAKALDACPYCGATDEPPTNGKSTNMSDTTTATTTATMTAIDKAATAAVALPEGVTVEALDLGVTKVTRLKGEAAVNFHKLGQAIREIYDGQLWKARAEGEGAAAKPKYTSFQTFCAAELGMTSVSAFKMMDVSKAFTEDDVRKFGASKLDLMLKVPEEHRPALLAKAEAGAGKRELGAAVADIKDKTGTKDSKRETGRKKTPKKPAKKSAGTAQKAEAKEGQLVALLKAGVEKFPMFKKPEKGAKGEPIAAKVLEDQPYAVIDTENGVRIMVAVLKGKDDQIFLQIKAMRPDAT